MKGIAQNFVFYVEYCLKSEVYWKNEIFKLMILTMDIAALYQASKGLENSTYCYGIKWTLLI